MPRVCKFCNQPIIGQHGNTKFCSDKCFDDFYRLYHLNWNAKHPKVEKDYTKNGHRAFLNIKNRTSNPSHKDYNNYGARGIYLELTFEEFIQIYFSTDKCANCGQLLNDDNRNAANGKTLDRIDQAKSYSKDNLRLLCRSCNCSLAAKRRRSLV